MKRTFHISSPPIAAAAEAVLLCEFSQHHACFAIADAATKRIEQLSYYELKNGLEPDKLQQLIKAENFDVPAFRRVVVNNAFKEVVLVPAHHFTEESAKRFYATAYGGAGEVFFYDELINENLVLVHALPQRLLDTIRNTRNTEIGHHYSSWLRMLDGSIDAEGMAVHFTSTEISVVAKRDNQLRFVQTYFYTAPLDVVYYMLAIAREQGLSQTGTTIVLSGLVDQDSAMYKELYQYFSHIRFWKPAFKAPLQSDYPHHFFSSIYNLAACAL